MAASAPPRVWRPEWRRREGAPFGYRAATAAVGWARAILEGDSSEGDQIEALEAMRRIVSDGRAGPHCRVGAARVLERHAKRLATAAMVERRNAAMARKMAGEEPP